MKSGETTINPPAATTPSHPIVGRPQVALFLPFAAFSGILILLFSPILFRLFQYAAGENIHSHILLIPFICGYLIWQMRENLPMPRRGSLPGAAIPAAFGLLTFAGFWILRASDGPHAVGDSLSCAAFSFVCLFLSGVLFLLGPAFARAAAFPLGFLFFMTPLPEALLNTLEIASQTASAEVFSWMIWLTGTPYLRDGQQFAMPGLSLVIAQECSGIRSSYVLFLTGLLAGHMFLNSTWKKLFLAFFVIPLGVIRNGFRVLTLSLLTIHWDPGVIDSPLHHRGGPIFFALSLIPFFLLLVWLRKNETKAQISNAH